jgi:hypothetical protein
MMRSVNSLNIGEKMKIKNKSSFALAAALSMAIPALPALAQQSAPALPNVSVVKVLSCTLGVTVRASADAGPRTPSKTVLGQAGVGSESPLDSNGDAEVVMNLGGLSSHAIALNGTRVLIKISDAQSRVSATAIGRAEHNHVVEALLEKDGGAGSGHVVCDIRTEIKK